MRKSGNTKMDALSEMNSAAREMGMTYGQYRVWLHFNGGKPYTIYKKPKPAMLDGYKHEGR